LRISSIKDEESGMSARRELTMRQLRQMLRLHHDGVSAREIGRRLGLARSTIQDNLKRAAAMGLGWPLPAELTDDELERRLFMRPGIEPGQRRRSEPDWAVLAREAARRQSDGVVGGIPGRPPGWLWLQSLLRSVP
jgi:hypothetical protein